MTLHEENGSGNSRKLHNPQKIEQNVKWRTICELETSSEAQGYGVAMQHGHKCF